MVKDNRLQEILGTHGIAIKNLDGSLRNVVDVLEDLYLKLAPSDFKQMQHEIALYDMENSSDKYLTIFDEAREREYNESNNGNIEIDFNEIHFPSDTEFNFGELKLHDFDTNLERHFEPNLILNVYRGSERMILYRVKKGVIEYAIIDYKNKENHTLYFQETNNLADLFDLANKR